MQALETILQDALEEAGTRALTLSRTGFKRWLKEDGSPVTQADLEADTILQNRLRAALPEAGWQSEESGSSVPQEPRFWLVDPIDGTASYAKADPGWCVAVALINHGAPELAGIFAPVSGAMFMARAGHGATRNGKPIQASPRTTLEGARLIANAKALETHGFPAVTRASLHSMCLRLCAVAEGEKDGMFTIGPKHDWDVAAGDLIVREAGGLATDLSGAVLRYGQPGQQRSGVVAAAPDIHAQIIARTKGNP